MGQFLDLHDRPVARTTTSHIKTNNNYFDPGFILNGTASVGAATATVAFSWFIMYSSGDPSYVSNQFDPGVNMGKAAAGNVFAIQPNNAANAVIAGSNTSMPASIGLGWMLNLFMTGGFDDSNWLMSVILLNPSTGTVNVQVGLRLWYGSSIFSPSAFVSAFSTTSPQYSPVISFQTAATASVAVVFSISVSGAGLPGGPGLGGPFLLSGQYFAEEWFMHVDTASGKSGTTIKFLTNG